MRDLQRKLKGAIFWPKLWSIPNKREFKPIELMIIGAQKAGTTSLNYYLGEHPEICTHERIEFSFFVNEQEYQQGYKKIFKKYYKNCDIRKKIIAKNVLIMYNINALKRLYQYNPNIKLVLILRNPVDRAYSAWLYEKRKGRELTKTFEEAIDIDNLYSSDNLSQYLDRSLYYKHLLNVFKFFGKKQIMIILFEEFKKDPLIFCKRIFKWLGVDPNFCPDVKRVHNKAAIPRSLFVTKLIQEDNILKKTIKLFVPQEITYKVGKIILKVNEKEMLPPPLSFHTRQKLLEFFSFYNQRLSELIQVDLSCWNQ